MSKPILPLISSTAPEADSDGVACAGLPPLAAGPLYPRFKRLVPEKLFYMLPALMWLTLSARHRSLTLPTAANPAMEAGGLWGESKVQGLQLFGPEAARWIASYVTFTLAERDDPDKAIPDILRRLKSTRIGFPIVAKPDRGYQGWGVRKLDDIEDLQTYLHRSEAVTIMLQRHVPYLGEAGVFYIRDPGAAQGRIVSLALIYAPHVIGDGENTLSDLVDADPILRANRAIYLERNRDRWNQLIPEGRTVVLTNARSARLGAVYRDASERVTAALQDRIEKIARDIPDFHFGRFDIRFRSVESLMRGEDFLIVELNGAGAEMLHLWDGHRTITQAYRTLWRQYRALFAIGSKMRRRGHRPVGVRELIRLQRRQEKLRQRYPTSS